ncbi:MAG TPA: hypothetical protein VH542_03815 [Steroidobacteraceae bacterium]|jgi:hypothetical protein
MKTLSRRALAGLALVGLAAGYSTQASAGCNYTPGETAASWLQGASIGKGSSNSGRSFSSIVGLWHVIFTAKNSPPVPDDVVIDDAVVTWHADGTEIMNSGKPPITSSFCMGTYEQKGSTYNLKHVALSWDPTGTQFVGQAIIRESVRLNHGGNGYSGTFTIDQYALDGTTVLAHVQGTVAGTRITVD